MPSPILGIDLGTTTSLVAIFRDGVPTILPNGLGQTTTPSVVSVDDDGSVLVGAPALARATTAPDRTARFFKRDMGTDRRFELGPQTFSAPELSACVLRTLRQDAEAALGMPVEEAVVTVPAYFDERQRQATRDAATIAGLRAERILNEPTAAALAYGLQHRGREARVAVLDLGGGTFDVTILEIIDGIIEIQATAGDTHLGGEDFSDALTRMLATRISNGTVADPLAWARLRAAADNARRTLTTAPTARVVVPRLDLGGRTVDVDVEVSTALLEEATVELVGRLRAPVLRALGDAKLRASQVDEVLLVGGATRMPLVVRTAVQIFGKLPRRDLPPDEAVALGAAVQAALKADVPELEDLVVTDVCPHTLGTSVITANGGHVVGDVFVPIIERGTTIPCSRVKRFSTTHPEQTGVRVEVYQGEHPIATDNRRLGEVLVDGIPTGRGYVPVDIRFTYDINGLLEVEANIDEGVRKASILIENVPGRMSPEQIEQARVRMQRLKFHPRELLPNRTALERADALYQELTGARRDQLGQILHGFRLALEGQDPETIASTRLVLERTIEAFG